MILSGCTGQSADEPKTASDGNPANAASGQVSPGQTLYEHNCMTCHGGDGTAGISGAANLQTTSLDSIAIFKTIQNGRGSMPTFKSTLSDKETALLTTYVRTIKK
ncbi:c-type cytochrome [Chitinophagaceae bacterium MMS25-I14]